MSMKWRVAKSLDQLLFQVNALAPNRSKASDGSIGNAEHAARSSDHNPWVMDGNTGVVTARDITNDPKNGMRSRALAEALRVSRDPRIKYIISDGEIANAKSVTKGGRTYAAWEWSPYSGKNAHFHHVHISVQPDKALYDDATLFNLSAFSSPKGKKAEINPALAEAAKQPVLVIGNKGREVERLQVFINSHGGKIDKDGDFGPKTEEAVKKLQRQWGIVADGRVGADTWSYLLK